MQGVSLDPVFKNRIENRDTPLFWKWGKGWAVTNGPWKLVSSDAGKTIELFNIHADRTETNNLAKQEPKIVEELLKLHADWLARCQVDAQTNVN